MLSLNGIRLVLAVGVIVASWGKEGDAAEVEDSHLTLYEDPRHKGASHYMRFSECENVPQWLNDRASSLNTHGGVCVAACEHSECEGRCVEFIPGSNGHHDLSVVNLDDSITSLKPC